MNHSHSANADSGNVRARNDGGPALPTISNSNCGMTLRDYFAAKAMQGILAGDHPITHRSDPLPEITRVAFEVADAMLKARSA